MLRTRLWMGAILVILAVGVLVVDQQLYPWYPFLFVTLQALVLTGTVELVGLLPTARRPPLWLCVLAVAALVTANWPAHILPLTWHVPFDPWHWVFGTFAVIILSAFIWEMATFRVPGESVVRIALVIWISAYMGLLPSYFAQLRWLPLPDSRATPEETAYHGTFALALAVFVPKVGDIGAYLTGRFLGRHPMTPVLSPKKTWEGFVGGLVASCVTAVALYRLDVVLRRAMLAAVGFGLTVGVASVLGDLAESLIKRDCGQKDAAKTVPGFGGILDVIDSVVFAAPVVYCWLRYLWMPDFTDG
jgi:phosphatidate cytidylyltransferase